MKKTDESERKAIKVEFRDQAYAEKVSTRIWQEQASESNPYIGQDVRIHGYNYKDLIMKSSFSDTLYLMLTGELPDKARAKLLERTLCAFANVGPRNNAVDAATSRFHKKIIVSLQTGNRVFKLAKPRGTCRDPGRELWEGLFTTTRTLQRRPLLGNNYSSKAP